MKKTKRVVGKCCICGCDVRKMDLSPEKNCSEPRVVSVRIGETEALACLCHEGVLKNRIK